jgi:hypothetical protein
MLKAGNHPDSELSLLQVFPGMEILATSFALQKEREIIEVGSRSHGGPARGT